MTHPGYASTVRPFVCLALLLAACGGEQRIEENQTTVLLEGCHVPGASRPALCGGIEVPEEGDGSREGALRLRVVVFPARDQSHEPDPVFFLAGGPGQASTEAFPAVLAGFTKLSQDRDVVLIDQRGTGASRPLDCPDEEPFKESFREGAFVDSAQRCLRHLSRRDLKRFGTIRAADDLDHVRKALGYSQINLIGGSYGTRLALVYARRHPESLRSMVIDGVAPTSMAMPQYFARDSRLALEAMLKGCEADPGCNKLEPRATLHQLIAHHAEPRTVKVRHPRTDVQVTITVTRSVLVQSIRAVLYSPELSSLLPLALKQMSEGEYGPFVAQVFAIAGGIGDMLSFGLLLTIACTEDVPFVTDQPGDTIFGDLFIREFRGACEGWPRAELPTNYRDPVTSAVPTLLLSGALDPATPASWAELAAATLEKSRHIIVPTAGHGTLVRGCVPSLVTQFIESADPSLDADCAKRIPRPPFFIDRAGPAQ